MVFAIPSMITQINYLLYIAVPVCTDWLGLEIFATTLQMHGDDSLTFYKVKLSSSVHTSSSSIYSREWESQSHMYQSHVDTLEWVTHIREIVLGIYIFSIYFRRILTYPHFYNLYSTAYFKMLRRVFWDVTNWYSLNDLQVIQFLSLVA